MNPTRFISLLWRGPWFVGSWALLIIRDVVMRLFGRDPYTQSRELQTLVDDSTKKVDDLRMEIDDLKGKNENLRINLRSMAVTPVISFLWRVPWFVGSWVLLIIRNAFGRLFGRDPYAQSRELQTLVDDSTKKFDDLRMEIDDLKEENENLRNKLDDFHKRSAQIMEKSGSLENTNDELSNTRLAERFDGSLKEQWLQLCDALGDTLNEIQYLTHLSEVMQSVFKHCTQYVEETEKHLLEIARYAKEDHKKVRHNLRVLRKPLGQKQSTRDCVVKDIVARVKQDDVVKDLLNEHHLPDVAGKTIFTFMNDFADICWLMCIANPPLKLNFDVKGVDFKSVSDRFVEFASTGDITNSDGKPGAVYLVAWPSVELEDSSGLLKKGEVIVCK